MTVIAIGLDSAEPTLLEKWMDEGELPNFAKLKADGCYGQLENFDVFTAELPWTTFATGVMPEETGYWTPLKYSPDYRVSTRAAYEYDKYPAFYALGDRYRVCSFDVPQVRLQKNLNGLQFNAWGAHSPQVEQESNEPEVYAELMEKHGRHPGLHRDYAHALNMDAVKRVYDMLMEGVGKRAKICADLVKREEWDLFLTVFGETHGAGHNFWQFQPEHPLYNADIPGRDQLPKDPLKNIFKEIDKGLGEILASAPKDAKVVVFSAHGMGPNTMDLPSTFFLPEFMYRYGFGRPALGEVAEMGEQLTQQTWGTWERHVWNTIGKGNPLIKIAREKLPTRLYNKIAPALEFNSPEYPMGPVKAKEVHGGRPWYQPTLWYSELWPKMKAFALPSFSEGYLRINLKGREANGIVEPQNYHAVVEDICAELNKLKCARTGVPMVKRIIKTRQDPLDVNPHLSDADIVIAWQEEFATDAVEHPQFGRIGPVPHFRAGSHRHTGFMFASGPGLAKNAPLTGGHALDIAPTILELMNVPIPAHIKGRCIPGVLPEGGQAETAPLQQEA